MTDRELLELAAKAAGVFLTPETLRKACPEWEWDSSFVPYHNDSGGMTGIVLWYGSDGIEIGGAEELDWNPRNDRADALNLSARLHINIEHGKHSVRAWTGDDAPVMVDETVFVADESKRSDANASTAGSSPIYARDALPPKVSGGRRASA